MLFVSCFINFSYSYYLSSQVHPTERHLCSVTVDGLQKNITNTSLPGYYGASFNNNATYYVLSYLGELIISLALFFTFTTIIFSFLMPQGLMFLPTLFGPHPLLKLHLKSLKTIRRLNLWLRTTTFLQKNFSLQTVFTTSLMLLCCGQEVKASHLFCLTCMCTFTYLVRCRY